MSNKNMHTAKRAKNDEFYTQLSDIEQELGHYREAFQDRVVYCNCDDPRTSNFFRYFAMNFNYLGLKKLITVSYNPGGRSSKIEITEVKDLNDDGRVGLADAEYLLEHSEDALVPLEGDGDFRAEETIALLKQADIVVTNPPFSLFRPYIAQLMEYDKRFLVIGNMNAITYKETFPLLKDDKMWLGCTSPKTFVQPDGPIKKFGNILWYTNLYRTTRKDELVLYKKYTPEEYPHYDNYDAINVNRTADIPYNYYGVMGVPITFLTKHNPAQFEIVGITDRQNTSGLRTKKYTSEDAPGYNDLNARSVIKTGSAYRAMYARILIKRREGGV